MGMAPENLNMWFSE